MSTDASGVAGSLSPDPGGWITIPLVSLVSDRSECRLDVVIVEPFFTPEQWQDDKVGANFVDQPDLKVARMDVSRRRGRIATIAFHYLVGTPGGIEHFTETHELGLFSHEQW